MHFQLDGSTDGSSKERISERSDAIETDPVDSASSESENEDEEDIAGKIDPQVLNAISDLYSSVR